MRGYFGELFSAYDGFVLSPMKEIYVFADETGDLGYNLVSGSKYFGFGTVILEDSSSSSMWEAFKLRCALETSGIPLVHGFHAQQDKFQIRSQVFNLILQSRPVFDFTFLNKANAIASVKAKGDLGLYKLAWYLHFQYIARRYLEQNVRLIVIVADLHTKARKAQIRSALNDVTNQFPHTSAELLVWDSRSSWGLQMADYGTWSAQRVLLGAKCEFWEPYVKPLTQSFYKPWN